MVKNNQQGWTIVELCIVVAILGLVVMIAPTILNETTKVFILGKTKLDLQQQARAAMYIMTRELRQAQSSSITIDNAAGQPFYSRISFTKPSGQTITYAQKGNSILFTMGTNNTVITTNLAYLAFTFPRSDDMTIVSVSMTLQEQIYGGAFKALHMASERVRVMN